jgi:hypothetical protein
MWGLDRPLYAAEMARVLKLRGRDPGLAVLCWERGKHPVSGPVSVAVNMMLEGYPPHTLDFVVAGVLDEMANMTPTKRKKMAQKAKKASNQ